MEKTLEQKTRKWLFPTTVQYVQQNKVLNQIFLICVWEKVVNGQEQGADMNINS